EGTTRHLPSPKALEEGAETLRPCGIGIRLLGDPAEQETREVKSSDSLAEASCIDLLASESVAEIRQNDHGQMIVGKSGELRTGDARVIDESVSTPLRDEPAESVQATPPVVERPLRPHGSEAWPRQHRRRVERRFPFHEVAHRGQHAVVRGQAELHVPPNPTQLAVSE